MSKDKKLQINEIIDLKYNWDIQSNFTCNYAFLVLLQVTAVWYFKKEQMNEQLNEHMNVPHVHWYDR